MKKTKEIYLPKWQRRFVPLILLGSWLVMTYQKFFDTAEEIGNMEYFIVTVLFLIIGVVIWKMASGKLPAYIIKENYEEDER